MRGLLTFIQLAFALIAFPLMCAAAAPLQEHRRAEEPRRVEQRVSKTFTVSGVPRVRLETFDGNITVRAWDKSEVTFNFAKSAQDEHEMRGISLRADEGGGEVRATATFDKAYSREQTFNGRRVLSNGASVELEVYVPRNVNLYAASGDGGISAEGVIGELDLRAKDGPIEVSNARASLRAGTGDGAIAIKNFYGDADAHTADGPISLSGHFTQLVARTEDGEISLALPAGTNATIETSAESVSNKDGVATAEIVKGSSPNVRRWRVGGGGNTFKLSTRKGSIYVRRAAGGS